MEELVQGLSQFRGRAGLEHESLGSGHAGPLPTPSFPPAAPPPGLGTMILPGWEARSQSPLPPSLPYFSHPLITKTSSPL